jgi:hypothetical protein
VDMMIKMNLSTYEVIPSNSEWIGVTYREDREPTMHKFAEMGKNHVYPNKLF